MIDLFAGIIIALIVLFFIVLPFLVGLFAILAPIAAAVMLFIGAIGKKSK